MANPMLIAARTQKGWSQARLAQELTVAESPVKRWESGERLPYPIHRSKLCAIFQKTEQELGWFIVEEDQPYWHVPYQRNPFFTGRKNVLQQLHTVLSDERSATLSQSYALSGLGGIGKTQTAIEYAYCYANDYKAIFWINAETHESIVSSFVAIIALLNLPEKLEKDQNRILAAVTHWLNTNVISFE